MLLREFLGTAAGLISLTYAPMLLSSTSAFSPVAVGMMGALSEASQWNKQYATPVALVSSGTEAKVDRNEKRKEVKLEARMND